MLFRFKNSLQKIRVTTMEDNFNNTTKITKELYILTTLKKSRTEKKKKLRTL